MTQLPSTFTATRWASLALTAGAIVAAVAWVASALASRGWLSPSIALACIAAIVAACLVLAFGALYRKLALVDQRFEWGERRLAALVNVRPLLGKLPTRLDIWAVDALFSEAILTAIMRERPRVVLECGSGASTVLIAACLAELGEGRVVSLDHDPEYARQTRALLAMRGLDGAAEVLYAPLKDVVIDGTSYRWYDFDPEVLAGDVDLLVVDGPPAGSHPRARYPAVPLLSRHLAERCVILADDGDRDAERWMVQEWAKTLPAAAEYLAGGRGGWIVTRDGVARVGVA